MRTIVAAAAAAIIVVLAAAIAAPRLQLTSPAASTSTAFERVAIVKRVAMRAPAVQSAAATGAPPSDAPLIARTAKVSLYVNDVDEAATAIGRIARSNAGDVFSSDITAGEAGVSQAAGSIEIRVPAQDYDRAIDAVASTGVIRERSSSAEDLTGSLTDSAARLRNLRRTEADIRRIMDRSGNVSQIMDAEEHLSQVREQVETIESELKEMRMRVAYATIDVDLRAEAAGTPAAPTAASQLASAWHGALASLLAFTVGLAALIVRLLVFLPYWMTVYVLFRLTFVYIKRRRAAADASV